ncbi:AsnC family protein [Actinokineospora sp. NPDC004072]
MTDAVDARLLGVVAEMGRAAVHEVAGRLGMDPREVASRLVALSASGLPLLVGVECDANGLRAALARMQPGYGYAPGYPAQPYPQHAANQNLPSGAYPGVPGGPQTAGPGGSAPQGFPGQTGPDGSQQAGYGQMVPGGNAQQGFVGQASPDGSQQASYGHMVPGGNAQGFAGQASPDGSQQAGYGQMVPGSPPQGSPGHHPQGIPGGNPQQGGSGGQGFYGSGPTVPSSGPQPAIPGTGLHSPGNGPHSPGSGPHSLAPGSGPHSPGSGPHSLTPPSGPHHIAPGSGPYAVGPYAPPSQPFPAQQLPPPDPGDPINTWGPPQTSTWARGDQPPNSMERTQPAPRPVLRREGVAGEALETEGLEGERLTIKLIEVVDPADYLFTAAGYTLQPGERSVVVHTELVNRGPVKFAGLPDLYLVLVADDGQEIGKAPVSLSSRPAHRIGVAPGETAGGHTVYVVPEDIAITAVRWTPRPDEESRALTWRVEP